MYMPLFIIDYKKKIIKFNLYVSYVYIMVSTSKVLNIISTKNAYLDNLVYFIECMPFFC